MALMAMELSKDAQMQTARRARQGYAAGAHHYLLTRTEYTALNDAAKQIEALSDAD